MSRWFKAGGKPHTPMIAETEEAHLEQVERALIFLLSDDLVSAEKILIAGESTYHHAGRGISCFLSSILGAERELLRNAAASLQDAENKAWGDMKEAQRETTAFRSPIYPAGTEYLLCHAIAQLTGAICAVLSGSVVQAIGGFAKLRKAFLTLDGIMGIEAAYFAEYQSHSYSKESGQATTENHENILSLESVASIGPNEKIDFGIPSNPNGIDGVIALPSVDNLSLHSAKDHRSDLLDFDPAAMGITSRTDIFIHSGTRLCYGILLVVFSMIGLSRVHAIYSGFKGDRENGTRHLWQASRFNNFNGAIAGITILMYYNGFCGFCDILPTDVEADNDISGFPWAKSKNLLSDMRKRYPGLKLWKLEEARMHAFDQNLTDAVKILTEISNCNMKEIATINTFELSLSAMFYHDYELTAKSWQQCSKLSSWSPALYTFLTGVAYLELYRNIRTTDPKTASNYKKVAIEHFRKAPPLAGKQKLMSKQLPFDMYIVRKCQKWKERSIEWDVDLVDSIGVSPSVEMIYLWNGIKKQNPDELHKSIEMLDWDRSALPAKHQSDLDETAIHALLEASVLRNLGEYRKAREILESKILCHNKQDFKGHLKDDWTYPNAHYEMACLAWQEKDLKDEEHLSKVLECKHWLEKIQTWDEQYVLDTRLTMKVMTGISTVERHRRVMGI